MRTRARRFRDTPGVELFLGDAMDLIPQILEEVTVPPFVYLDGHFTGGVNQEPGKAIEPAPDILAALGELSLPQGSTLVVDDLRLFGRRGGGFPGARRAHGGGPPVLPRRGGVCRHRLACDRHLTQTPGAL